MIDLKNVYLIYDNGAVALKDINLHINKGEFVFIVGPTGCGKSSLLKLISREELASRGVITAMGRNLTELPPAKVPYHRRQVGVIFQDFKLMPERTIWRNVSFAMEVVGEHPAKINRRVPHVLELVGLSDKAVDYPRSLSGGEMQRVALARAIANRPVILLADEPTGNLDPNTSWEIVQLLQKVNAQGTTIAMATHDYNIVGRMKKRIISIKDGRMLFDKPPGEAPGFAEKP